MYESYFGLRERPFDLAPNPRYLYRGPHHREALSTLRYALEAQRGLTLLVGEAGTGKTTLVQTVLSEIGHDRTQCVLVSNPTLTREEFFEFLAHAFNLGADAAASKARFLVAFQQHLEARHAAGQLTAILIDEAQSLPDDLLEEVRLLSNIETTTEKLVTVVLTGQPELVERLNEPKLRQLKQRIALRAELSVFDLMETAAYIAGRLRIAGGKPAEIFTRDAVDAIHQGSKGVPRVINVIGDNALIGGFAAQVKPVPRSIVTEIIGDFDLTRPRPLDPVDADSTMSADAPTSGNERMPTVQEEVDGNASSSRALIAALGGRRGRAPV